ncbi:hypothetical protein BLA29_000223 [Euroglyphus maynei]|uniref:Uncharacterized protein n=1 Tax=Euroglyphus maynei TaxID=6958 RepID=A0A1Y3BXE8_EURMA|nr:hypothetical protein BLA29_000223 [Euroglyphus maynei]
MSQLLTHRIRFFYYEPTSINCIDFNEKLGKLALLRRPIRKHKPSQNDMPSIVEIWNVRQKAWYLEQTIHEDPDQSNLLEAIAWSRSGRLFSCGLNSYLNEYDLSNGRISRSYCVNSDPAWCMTIDSDNELIAVGTEKGFICIFKMFDDCLQFEKIMPKNDNRILCLQWHHRDMDSTNLLLIAGSIDFVKIYSYRHGKCIDFIRIGNNRIVCWCLKVLKDFTIITGDSNGTVSFWNGKTVTLIQSYNSHRADVLTLCTTNDEDIVLAAGVDPTIVQFQLCYGSQATTWVCSRKRRPHNHDIRSMLINQNLLISGGIDSFLSQISINSSFHISYLTNLYHKCSFTSNDRNCFIGLMYDKFIQIWRLGDADPKNELNSLQSSSSLCTRLKLSEKATKLLDVKSRKPIIAFDMNCEWIIYASYQTFKALTWSEDGIKKIKILHDPISNISNIRLLGNDHFVISYGHNFDVFKLDRFGIVLEYSGISYGQKRIIRILSTENRMIILTADNCITVYDLNHCKYEPLYTITSFVHQPCALAIDKRTKRLWLSFANSMLIEYDLDNQRQCQTIMLNKFKSNENKESRSFNEHWTIKQIAFTKNNSSILLADENNLYMLNIERQRMTKCDKYHHIIAMANIRKHHQCPDNDDDDDNQSKTIHYGDNDNDNDDDDLVIVEVTNQMIMATLPPLLITRTYGIS